MVRRDIQIVQRIGQVEMHNARVKKGFAGRILGVKITGKIVIQKALWIRIERLLQHKR